MTMSVRAVLSGIVAVAALGRAGAAWTQAPSPDVAAVLTRAAAFVAAYEQSLGSVLAEERYRQDVSAPSDLGAQRRREGGPSDGVVRLRVLESEFLFLSAPGPLGRWLGLRDTLFVDGRPVPERGLLQGRLARDSSLSSKEFQRLVDESARYNIGRVTRNVNVPTFALVVLHADVQPRFSFVKREERRLAGTPAWVLAFEEQVRPTIIRSTEGAYLPARGTLWVDPESGRVIQTELFTAEPSKQLETRIAVTYRPNKKLGIWVTVEMTERYDLGPAGSADRQRIDCLATYSNFRRFEVKARIRP